MYTAKFVVMQVKKFYDERGTEVINLDFDQDSTDMEKCIRHIEDLINVENTLGKNARPTIIVIGALGGRLDHELASLSLLHKYDKMHIVIANDACMTFLLCRGMHRIYVDHSCQGPSCGLIPLAGPAIVTTSGLRWNLKDTELKIGHLVSTSNELVEECIKIHTDQPLLWTCEIKAWNHR